MRAAPRTGVTATTRRSGRSWHWAPTASCTCPPPATSTRYAGSGSRARTSSPPGASSTARTASTPRSASGSRRPATTGGTSIHSTGSSPGFITEAIPLVLTSIQRQFDGLTISEFADLSQRDSPDLLFNMMGFGQPAAEFDARRFSFGGSASARRCSSSPTALSMPLDSVEASGEVATARHSDPHRRRHAGGRHGGRAADDRVGYPGRQAGAALLRHLVLHRRPGSVLGRPRHRLACPGRRRRAARHRHPLSGAARADGGHLARLHGQPRGQRGAVRLRCSSRGSARRSTSPRSLPRSDKKPCSAAQRGGPASIRRRAESCSPGCGPLTSLRREPEGAVEADDLAVEVVVLADVLDQGRVLGGSAHPLGVRDLRAPVGRQLVACLAVGRGQVVPGAMVTTRMPTGDRSRAATRVILTTPPLAAA